MSGSIESGSLAEQLAAEYLINAGYGILHRNWHFSHKEIDIVAEKNDTLIVVEVKSRPERGITADDLLSDKKIRNIIDAAQYYIEQYEIVKEVQFDIIIITYEKGGVHIEHIENAFVPGVNW